MTTPLATLIERKLSRRTFLKAGVAGGLLHLASPMLGRAEKAELLFTEIPHSVSKTTEVAKGYQVETVLRWGDGLFAGSAPFDPQQQTAKAQAQQFGYNNDYVAYMPIQGSRHGLLCVNHEYPQWHLMFSGVRSLSDKSMEQRAIELEAVGHSVVEVKREDAGWKPVVGSRYNRRITATTPCVIHGPARGVSRMRTKADPEGVTVLGTFSNCAGGKTPWGTVLTAEENFDMSFRGQASAVEERNYSRYGIGKSDVNDWGALEPRFDVSQEPNEANRFGWVVEIDPYDPESMPKKRTALGRFKHEGATTALAKDGRVVVYMGDDERFEYLYKFVTEAPYDPSRPDPDMLDKGVLYVAEFTESEVIWHPLVHGQNGVDESNGFFSQADVCIETRHAADIVGATPMDRPEDVEANPVNQSVFVVLTNNHKRLATNPANPRRVNHHGHILELMPPEGDHAAERYQWDIFLQAGDPSRAIDRAMYQHPVTAYGVLSCPDNIAFDAQGRLWIATDGMSRSMGVNDGVYMAETEGPAKGATRHFFNAPYGAEVCGPEWTPDGETLFLAIQHPGDMPGSNFDNPGTRWPDFDENMPPRPSVVAIVTD